MPGSKGKKRKSYYIQAAKGKRARHAYKLSEGMKGFLITCNKNEKQAVREAYNIFNDYADSMFGKEQKNIPSSESDEDDIASSLEKEVSALKDSSAAKKRFQVVESGASNCVFIKTTLDKPDELLHKIFSDLHQRGEGRSRFMLRISPVMATCRAEASKIQALAEKMFPDYFKVQEPKSYSIMFKVRNNNSVGRQMVYGTLGRTIAEMSPLSKVDLDSPELVINVDVLQTTCCVGIVKDFYKFKKYNIQEVVKETKSPGLKVGDTSNVDNMEQITDADEPFIKDAVSSESSSSDACPASSHADDSKSAA